MSARRPASLGAHGQEESRKQEQQQQPEPEEGKAERKNSEEPQEEAKDGEPKLTPNQQRVQFSAPAIKQIIHPHTGSVLAKEPQRSEVPAERLQRLQEAYRRWSEERKEDKAQEGLREDGGANGPEGQYEEALEMDEETLVALMKSIGHDRCPNETVASTVRSTMAQLEMSVVRSWDDLRRMYEYFYAPTGMYGEQLRRACARGDLNLAHELIARGCDVECCNGAMMTPLHYCAEYDQRSAAELLFSYVNHGCNEEDDSGNRRFVNAKDRYGWTALMTAANNGASSVVSLLLRHGADVNATNKQGRTALHVAAAQSRGEICEKLLEAGADVNARDASGMTAAHVAAMFGNMAVYALLTSHPQFDVDSTDSLEHTPKEYLAAATAV